MSTEKVAWWKDPRFLIPTVVVPVALAVIAVAPSFFRDRVSDELGVSIELNDARSTPSAFDITIEQRFSPSESSGLDAARAIAGVISAEIRAHIEQLMPERNSMNVQVGRGDDGAVYVREPFSGLVGIHLSRFVDVTRIRDLTQNQAIQRPLDRSANLGEGSQADLRMRAGLYRVILTAPGYRDEWVLLQLDEDGTLLMATDELDVAEVQFPIEMGLSPLRRSSLIVALDSCASTPATGSEPRYQAFGAAFVSALALALDQQGFESVILEAGHHVGFDLSESKNAEAPEGLIRADLVIRHCRTEWLN